MKMKPHLGPKKTNPNKPNFKRDDGFSARLGCGDGGKKIKRAGYQGINLSVDYIQSN